MSGHNNQNLSEQSSLLLNDNEDFYLSKDSPQNINNYGQGQSQNEQSSQNQEFLDSEEQEMNIAQRNQQFLLLKIGKMMHQLVRCKEKVNVYEEYCHRLRAKIQAKEVQNEELICKIQQLNEEFIVKNDKICQQMDQINDKNEKLRQKIQQLELKLTEKDLKIKQLQNNLEKKQQQIKKIKEQQQRLPPPNQQNSQLTQISKLKKKNKQLHRINKILQEELSLANRKIIQLEKDYQNTTCERALGNIYRLKDSTERSSLLQNQQNNIRASKASRENTNQNGFERSVPMKGLYNGGITGIGGIDTGLISFLKEKNNKFSQMQYNRGRALSHKNY